MSSRIDLLLNEKRRELTYGDDPVVGPLDGRYWDCECEAGDYIHLRSALAVCDKCGAEESDQPDSRVYEIRRGRKRNESA